MALLVEEVLEAEVGVVHLEAGGGGGVLVRAGGMVRGAVEGLEAGDEGAGADVDEGGVVVEEGGGDEVAEGGELAVGRRREDGAVGGGSLGHGGHVRGAVGVALAASGWMGCPAGGSGMGRRRGSRGATEERQSPVGERGRGKRGGQWEAGGDRAG